MKLNNKKIKADNIVLNELERLSKIENNDLFASELDKFIEKSKTNDFYEEQEWVNLEAEGFPNVVFNKDKVFKYVNGREIKIEKKNNKKTFFIRPTFKGKRKSLAINKLLHKYFGNNVGWINLSIISDFYSNYDCNPDLGLIRNVINGRILKTEFDGERYMRVTFYNVDKTKQHPIHRIVAFVKWGTPLDDLSIHVNHKNENKKDNRACNLIVFTPKQNVTWSATNKTGFTNIHQHKNGKYYYYISKHSFTTDISAYEWRCWGMPIAGIDDLKEGFREPINRDKEWMSLDIVDCPNFVINQQGKILNITQHSIDNHTEKDYIGYIKTYKNKKNKQYFVVHLKNKKNKYEHFFIHELLAKCFIFNPDPEKYIKVDHDDNDGLNNSLDNLSWTINRHNCTKDKKRKGKYPNVFKSGKNKFGVRFQSNLFDTLEECIADMKRVYKLLGLEYVDRNELRANEEIPE